MAIGQGGLTASRARRQGPAKGQRVAIGITGATAIELHGLAARTTALIGARIGHRADVVRGNGDRSGQAIERAVVDDELRHIGAEDIGDKGGIDQGSYWSGWPDCQPGAS